MRQAMIRPYPFSLRIAEDALRLVDIRPGMRFLDVAAGGGALSIPAARLGAQVLATDISPNMIELLTVRTGGGRWRPSLPIRPGPS